MAPPRPPAAVDMRRSACCVHSTTPTTFTASTRCRSCSSNSATRVLGPMAAALLTRAVSGPSSSSTVANSRSTCAASLTSAATATALPPAASISAHSRSAASGSVR